jgi:hypothetical protein
VVLLATVGFLASSSSSHFGSEERGVESCTIVFVYRNLRSRRARQWREFVAFEMHSEECVVSSVLLGLDLRSVTGQGGSFFLLAYDPSCCGNGVMLPVSSLMQTGAARTSTGTRLRDSMARLRAMKCVRIYRSIREEVLRKYKPSSCGTSHADDNSSNHEYHQSS